MQLTKRGDEHQDHYGVSELVTDELHRTRRHLAANLGLTHPRSPARGPIESHLDAVDAELARRSRFCGTYPGDPRQVAFVRQTIAKFLADCPRADEATLIVSELAANAVLHSESGNGGEFIVRAELHADFVWVEVEDVGGDWHRRRADDRPHGLDIVETVCGNGAWGVDDLDTGRVVWARLDF